LLCNFTETNLQNYFKQPNKKNRFIFQKYIYFAVLFSKNKNVF